MIEGFKIFTKHTCGLKECKTASPQSTPQQGVKLWLRSDHVFLTYVTSPIPIISFWNLLFYVWGLEVVNCCYFALIYELCGSGNNRTIHCMKHSSLSDSENPAEKNNPVPLQ